jgi:hypothetical protein
MAAFGYAILEPVSWRIFLYFLDETTATHIFNFMMSLFPIAVVVLSVLTVVEINRHINHSERNDFIELKHR